jgi:hypothetical protein
MIKISNEARGSLGVVEFSDLPFTPVRTFWIWKVPEGDTRGHHAHHSCEQFLAPLSGMVSYTVTDRTNQKTTGVLVPGEGLYLPTQNWIVLSEFSPDCVVLVYCSHSYSESDYIRDLDEFLGNRSTDQSRS